MDGIVFWLVVAGGYWLYRHGKRIGSKAGYRVGRSRGRTRGHNHN